MTTTALSSTADQRIAEVLADPIVKMMMRADGVDRGTLVEELRDAARKLARKLADDEEPASDDPPGWLAANLSHLKTVASGVCCR